MPVYKNPKLIHHKLIIAVGSHETGFYQVPIIQIASGESSKCVDSVVSGMINSQGQQVPFQEEKIFGDISGTLYGGQLVNGQTVSDAKQISAVAIIPDLDVLGKKILLGGAGIEEHPYSSGEGIFNFYHAIVNGFAVEDSVIGNSGNEGGFDRIKCYKEGGEYFQFSGGNDTSSNARKDLRSHPDLVLVAGTYWENRDTTTWIPRDENVVGLDRSVGACNAHRSMEGITNDISGVLALWLLGVENDADPDKVKTEIQKIRLGTR